LLLEAQQQLQQDWAANSWHSWAKKRLCRKELLGKKLRKIIRRDDLASGLLLQNGHNRTAV